MKKITKIMKRPTRYKLVTIVFFSCLLVSSFIIGFNFTNKKINSGLELISPKNASTDRGVIFISSDSSFTEANGVISGEGTETEPYIIANWRIIGPFGQPCIEIRDTTAFFVVQDCIISNGENGTGIRLATLQNGVLMNNTIFNSQLSILCEQVNNVNVSDNICYDSSDIGIYINYSENILISDNELYDNSRWGIFLYYTNSCSIIGNFAYQNLWDGIRLETCFFNSIQNNTCTNNDYYGIILYYSEENILTQNNCSFNVHYGIAFVFESRDNDAYENFLSSNGGGCIFNENDLNNCYDNDCVEGGILAFFLMSKKTVVVGEIVEFTDYSSSDFPIIEYIWDFGDGKGSSDSNPSHSYDEIGRKTVTLVVKDSTGASSSTSRTIVVEKDGSDSNSDDPFANFDLEINGYPFLSLWIILMIPLIALIRKINNKRK